MEPWNIVFIRHQRDRKLSVFTQIIVNFLNRPAPTIPTAERKIGETQRCTCIIIIFKPAHGFPDFHEGKITDRTDLQCICFLLLRAVNFKISENSSVTNGSVVNISKRQCKCHAVLHCRDFYLIGFLLEFHLKHGFRHLRHRIAAFAIRKQAIVLFFAFSKVGQKMQRRRAYSVLRFFNIGQLKWNTCP